ncbi:MAG: 3-hydroxyacyl-CoA dehydrogenase NAD-binding domain-containing protein [Deltaproteobacteria bacterium]|nr:3-hydroxyacyl-CoA dehydrogenase NAD-binding domain-containing protein [Deltaproteobacteria bacterium]
MTKKKAARAIALLFWVCYAAGTLSKELAMSSFKKVCVIGAGVMGQGIAAHVANARIPVLLLDIVPPTLSDDDKKAGLDVNAKAFRNKFAAAGRDGILKSKPALLFTRRDAELIEIGNLSDDVARVSECDLVIEVVVERLDIKQKLFAQLEGLIKPGTVVTSNTSGLSIEGMTAGRSDAFKKNFAVTHFFNPVRYMALLEIVAGQNTDLAVVDRLCAFGERTLGKGIVRGKDTPNFVANRIGVFGMMETIRVMLEDKYNLEEVDAVFGAPTGRAKSAVFGTADVVGLDTFVHVAQNCWDNLQADESHAVFEVPAFLKKMVENKWLGRKTKGGFYKKVGDDILTLDYTTMEYRAKAKVRFESLGAVRNMESTGEKLKSLMGFEDRAATLFWKVTAATLIYSANRLATAGGTEPIADDLAAIDNAMKWGFMHEMGPFEMWDAMGVAGVVDRMKTERRPVPAWVDAMLAAGRTSFYVVDAKGTKSYWDPKTGKAVVIDEGPRVQSFTLLKANKTNVVDDAYGTTLVDLGDGILACEFHTKLNAVDDEIVNGLNKALDLCESGKFEGLVLANDGRNFSAGANIVLLFLAAKEQQWESINTMVKAFQDVCVRLKYSSIPTVAAPFDLTLGGGAEMALWCNRIRAHAELYMGLVEVGVGLIPGGGGNIEMLARSLEGAIDDPTYPVEQLLRRALETVAMAKVATSAEEAKELLYLGSADGVTLNRRHVLAAAKAEALGMARAGFVAPRRRTFRLPGRSAYATFEMALSSMRDGHFISDHDLKISMKVASVMTGGDCSPRQKVTEQQLLDLEREAFLSLCGEEKTLARISHMVETNKPLRN